ncbi:MAG: protein kinase domain-containing protein [Lentisphaeria bacterium]
MTDYKTMPILVVDDDEADVFLVKDELEAAGFKNVHDTQRGSEALALLGLNTASSPQVELDGSDLSFALVVLDVMLPDIDGFEICRQIKQRISPFFPVIMLTGLDAVEDHITGIEAGADDFISKPFQPEQLLAKITLLLSRSQQAAASGDSATMTHLARPYAGQRVGEYTITKLLGWSGTSLIYRAEHENGDGFVIKLLAEHTAADEEVYKRFDREMRIMSELNHPNLIRIYDHGTYRDCPFYVMEYLAGKDLRWLIHDGQVPGATILAVATGLAEVLKYVHDNGVVHRDIKLDNVYLGPDQVVKLGDFGIALTSGDTRLTRSNTTLGTPFYIAPEQFLGRKITAAVDVYSYGATLYHLLVGEPPFTGDNAMAVLHRHLHDIAQRPSECRPGVPKVWDELLVDQCLAKEPHDRPADMEIVLDRLAVIAADPAHHIIDQA